MEGSRKPKNFDANFHRILKKGFPDWERRIEYEQKQRKLYESAQNKFKMSPLEISSPEELLSTEKKDAIAYFQGPHIVKNWKKDLMYLTPVRHFF